MVLETPSNQIVGRPLVDFVHSSDKNHVNRCFERAKSTNRISHIQFHWMASPEKKVFVEAIVTASWDGLVCIFRNPALPIDFP